MPFSCWMLCIYALWLKVSPIQSGSWSAEVPQTVVGLEGSCVVIPCLYKYPGADRKASHITGIWLTNSNDNAFHSDSSKISSAYQQRTSLLGDLSHRNCSLRINPLRHSDGGPFMFRIEIEDFNKYSYGHSKVSITIKDSPEQPTLSMPEGIRSGKRVTVTCSVLHSCPSNPPNFTWSHKGTVNSQSLPQTNGQWKIISSLSFTPSKTDHKRTLTCTAVFQGGKEATSMTTLEVKYAPENVAVISDVSVVEGGTLNLTCSSDSNPAPNTYQWSTGAGTLLSEGHTLTLRNVSRHIEAIYCTAINTEGQANSSPKLLSILYPPEIKIGSSCTLDTSKVTCTCIVDSHPVSEIKLWGADPSIELRRSHEEKHGTLTIVTLHGALGFSDMVHCQATNSQGNYTMTLQVSHSDDTHSTKFLYISIAAIAFLLTITGLSVWITKSCRRNESLITPQPKTELNVTSQSEAKRKCKDVSSCYDGSQHVYGNMEPIKHHDETASHEDHPRKARPNLTSATELRKEGLIIPVLLDSEFEEPYEEEYPYEHAGEYEATYANV